MPEVAERCSQFWLVAFTDAVQVTARAQFVVVNRSCCPGGFDCSKLAINVRFAGATCNVQGCGDGVGVGVPGTGVVDGKGVPGVAVLVGPTVGSPGTTVLVAPAVGPPGTTVFDGPPGAGELDKPGEDAPGKTPMALAEETTVTCARSVCERNSVSKSSQPRYIPGASLPASISKVVFVLTPGCSWPLAGVICNQVARGKPCQLVTSTQPGVVLNVNGRLVEEC